MHPVAVMCFSASQHFPNDELLRYYYGKSVYTYVGEVSSMISYGARIMVATPQDFQSW